MAQKEMRIDKPYLNLPVRPGAPFVWVNWERPDGSLLYEFYVELDFEDPDYYVPCHVERWMGETLRLRIDELSDERIETLVCEAKPRTWTKRPTSAGRGCISRRFAALWGIRTVCTL